ncbi:MAG TPA: hypothetical protein ENK55_10210 [Actinobacteria bacterium]|nr:hypothetical protein [Actinomycetota bacterium]
MSAYEGSGNPLRGGRRGTLRGRSIVHATTVPYYYRAGVLLVAREDLDATRRALRRLGIGGGRLEPLPTASDAHVELRLPPSTKIDLLVEELGSLEVEPDYVLLPGSHVRGLGAARPRPHRGTHRPRPRRGRGKGVTIGVVDLGYFDPDAAGQPAWMRDGVRYDGFVPPPRPGRLLPAYVGHGNAVVGILRQLAPEASVVAATVDRDPDDAPGLTCDTALAATLRRLLCRNRIHVLVVPFGGSTRLGSMPLTEAVLAPYLESVAVFAPAGNDGLDPTLYPAVDPEVAGVAAWAKPAESLGWPGRACRWVRPLHDRGRDLELAPWSNRGLAAELAAPGVDVPAPFVEGRLRIRPGPRARSDAAQRFDGWARFTGTSFAAAVAAGCHAGDAQFC